MKFVLFIRDYFSGTPYYYHLLILFKRKLARSKSPTNFICTTFKKKSFIASLGTNGSTFQCENVLLFRRYGIIPNGCQNIGTSRIWGPPLSEGKTQFTVHKIANAHPIIGFLKHMMTVLIRSRPLRRYWHAHKRMALFYLRWKTHPDHFWRPKSVW
jgi:hypothetical protein